MKPILYDRLTLGVNLRGLTAGVTMRPGEAQDAMDVVPREDGAFSRVMGWIRVNYTALSGRPLGMWGISYRGKNVPGGDTARGGNFGVANDGADFTRRTDEFSSFILLTTTTFYRWNPSTEAFASVALPGGVAVDPVKPVLKGVNECVYVVGWADSNLRYDPTDLALYRWGWDETPAAPGLAIIAGGDLVQGVVYRYGCSFLDLYTGEESAMATFAEVTIGSGADRTVRVTVPVYGGSRHFNTGATATDRDVAVNIWRTFGDRNTFYFLTTLNPGTLTYDDGEALGVAADLEPFRGDQVDEPRFTAFEEFRGRFYGTSRFEEGHRLHFSDLNFFGRWRALGYRDLPVTEGDALTSVGKTDTTLLVHRRRGGFRTTPIETGRASPDLIPTDLAWSAGAVGPRGREFRDGYEYWLSERGPMRWREGMLTPQWIGKPLAPMFVDPNSGICRLSETARELSELCFDWESQSMRFVFALGTELFPNQFWGYWTDAEKYNGDPESGWVPLSPRAQTMTRSIALTRLGVDGKPVSPQDRIERFVFADHLGYVYEYDRSSRRGGLPPGSLAKGFVAAGSTTGVVQVDGGLFTLGDQMRGLRFEVVYANGDRHARTISSNTDTAVTLDSALPSAPADGDIWYAGGMPSFWRSWPDHFGSPHQHKRVTHLFVGQQRLTGEPAGDFEDWRADVAVAAGEFPQSFGRERHALLSLYRRKMTVSLTGVYWNYEVSNTRPDESFVVTNLEPEVELIATKRRAGVS